MSRLLIVIKIVIYLLVFAKAFQTTPFSMPLSALALAMLTCDFSRSASGYRSLRLNLITILLNIIFAVLFSWLTKGGSFDKLCLLYVIEEIAILPKPHVFISVPLTLLLNIGSSIIYDISKGVSVELAGFAEILLYVLVIVLVVSERVQREQRLAYERLNLELSYLNQRLQESLAWNEELAAQAERRRLAGEIHDSLGHDLTGLILTLEAGNKLMIRDPEAAKPYWDRALQVSRTALNSVRELVSEKTEFCLKFELIPRLQRMAGEVEALTPIRIDLDIKIDDQALLYQEAFNLYRIFQEAITNTMRHASASHIIISISGNTESIAFSYYDNGIGTNDIEAGNGLNGMKARMSELGGTIHFQSDSNKGFKIEGHIERRGISYE